MLAKIHSRMRLKGDLDAIFINLSSLEGFSPKSSQVNVRIISQTQKMPWFSQKPAVHMVL